MYFIVEHLPTQCGSRVLVRGRCFLGCLRPKVDNDFILPLEKEVFIEQLKDIVDKAEDMLSEDTEGERTSDLRGSPKQSEGAGPSGMEVSALVQCDY